MKWLTRLVAVLISLGGLATIGIFGVLIFSSSDSATANAALLQYGKAAAMVLGLGLLLGVIRAICLSFKR